MLKLNERAAQIMEHLVRHNLHGYSQYSRNGDGGRETITLSDGSKVTIATGDRDCSSAVIDAYRSAGLKLPGASYTGNMRNAFLSTGCFKWHPGTSYSAKRGDIYLVHKSNNDGHTAMCTQPYGSPKGDLLAEFSISEKGTIDGKEGDQLNDKGWYAESHEKPYYDFPWDGILEFTGKSKKPTPVSKAGKVDVFYQLKMNNGEWLEEVKNYQNENDDGYAGWRNRTHTALKMRVSAGSIRYRVHSLDGKWCKWMYNGDVASTQDGHVIDAVQAYYITPDGREYQQVWYRSSCTGDDTYYDTCCDDGTTHEEYDGYAGIYGKPLDALQCYIGLSDEF